MMLNTVKYCKASHTTKGVLLQQSHDCSLDILNHITIYAKLSRGGNIRGFRDYAANHKCFPLKYSCEKNLKTGP